MNIQIAGRIQVGGFCLNVVISHQYHLLSAFNATVVQTDVRSNV